MDIRQMKKYRHRRTVRAMQLETGNWLVVDGETTATFTPDEFAESFEITAMVPKRVDIDGRATIIYE